MSLGTRLYIAAHVAVVLVGRTFVVCLTVQCLLGRCQNAELVMPVLCLVILVLCLCRPGVQSQLAAGGQCSVPAGPIPAHVHAEPGHTERDY